MKTFLLVTLVLSPVLATHSAALTQQQSVTLKSVRGAYKSLDAINPVLVNGSDKSIFLLPEDCGQAQVSFLGLQYWEPSEPPDCQENTVAIEIKPGDSYRIPCLAFRTGKDANGQWFEAKNMPGSYKIAVRYAPEPIIRNGPPQLKQIMIAAGDFKIIK